MLISLNSAPKVTIFLLTGVSIALYVAAFTLPGPISVLSGYLLVVHWLIILQRLQYRRSAFLAVAGSLLISNSLVLGFNPSPLFGLRDPSILAVVGIGIFILYPLAKALLLHMAGVLASRLQSWLGGSALFGAGIVSLETILGALNIILPDQLVLTHSDALFHLQMADLLGASFLSWLVAATSYIVFRALTASRLLRQNAQGIIIMAGLHAFVVAYGGWRLAQPPVPERETLSVNLIQPNIPWEVGASAAGNPYLEHLVENRLLGLTKAANSQHPAELTVWPEFVTSKYLSADPDFIRLTSMHAGDSALLFGTLDYDHATQTARNGAVLLNPRYGNQIGVRHKTRLVPVYETKGLTPGQGYPVLKLNDNLRRLGVTICYESILPEPSRALARGGARLFFNLSNTGVFGASHWSELQARQAILRAIENHRWVVHLNNTGNSTIVDPHGRIHLKLAQGVADHAFARLPLLDRETGYTSFGYLFAPLISVAFVGFASVGLLRGLRD